MHKKKVIILDLDNTIYPVSSIADSLFKTLFSHIEKSGEFEGNLEDVKLEIQRTPFQKVAVMFSFSKNLLSECMQIHHHLTYDSPMKTFDDYKVLQGLPHKKFLVTSGFTLLQKSKVKQLGIEDDFEEIHIIDLQVSNQTKKDVFGHIIKKHNFNKKDVVVIGDDLSSEIKAALELNIDCYLYHRNKKEAVNSEIPTIATFSQLIPLI